MLLSTYENMLKERLKNTSSKSGYARNFIVGECYGVIRTAMSDPDISFDECAYLWDLIAVELQKLSLSDFSKDSELRDNMHTNMKIRELCMSGIDESIDQYKEHEHDCEYCRGVIDGLIMYCDIYCNCPEELDELKEKRNKEIYKILDKRQYI